MPRPLHSEMGEPLNAEWTSDQVKHACRCALHVNIDSFNESRFLISLADMKGQSLFDVADDAEMKPKTYAWLKMMCGTDYPAISGLNRVRKLKYKVACRVRNVARRRGESS